MHWNTSLYDSPAVAMTKSNGLAVLAVFIDIGYQTNAELDKVLKQIDEIIYKGDKKMVNEGINITKLMPCTWLIAFPLLINFKFHYSETEYPLFSIIKLINSKQILLDLLWLADNATIIRVCHLDHLHHAHLWNCWAGELK